MSQTLEQRESALANVNRIRLGNAIAKRELRARELTLEQALGRETCQSSQVLALLLAIPGVGRVKATKAMSTLGLIPSKRVAGLSERQIKGLIAWSRSYDRRRDAREHIAA